MLPRFFIDRPVFASVIALLIVLAGSVSITMLPVAQYPQITPPQISIRANYPGADAQTVAQTVAAPIEDQLSGIQNLLYYSSQSSNDGSISITATFANGTDQDIAAVEVQNRLKQAEPQLPAEVIKQGVSITKSNSSLVAVAALQSDNPRYDALYLNNYATIHLIDQLKRVEGVGDARVFPSQAYAMRIWVDPDRLATLGLTVTDVAKAIESQNATFPAGAIGQRPVKNKVELTIPVLSPGRLEKPKQYANIILRGKNTASVVRLGDVGRIQLGAQSYNQVGRVDGKPTALLLLNLQNGANALNTMDGVRSVLDKASQSFPPGVSYNVPYDTTRFIRDSISEVLKTLVEAVLLVIVVIFVFLQSWRATLIPLLVVPVAVVGTFAGLLALGFSINTLTLFGLVLTIGIVVDDAIVVIENVERVMDEDKLLPREATIKAMKQVSGPVITVVLVLCAVFVPVAFLGGLVGQLYRQFAVTIVLSVAISGLMALTLSPALCRVLLKPQHKEPWFPFRWFNTAFGWIVKGYMGGVSLGLKHAFVMIGIFVVLCYSAYRLDQAIPSGFVPQEDQGLLICVVQLPEGASLSRTQELSTRVINFVKKQPQVRHVVTLDGVNLFTGFTAATNASTMFMSLKPFDQRTSPAMSVQALQGAVMKHFAGNKVGLVIAVNPPPIHGLGFQAGFEMQLESRSGGSLADLYQVEQKFIAAAAKSDQMVGVHGTLQFSQPQLMTSVDREKAKMMGVPVPAVYQSMQPYLGGLYVNDFNLQGRIWRVMLQAESQARRSPSDIDRIYVRNDAGKMVPLSTVVKKHWQAGPNAASRFDGFPSVQINGASPPGVSSGQTMDAVRQLAKKVLPPGYAIEWSGASYQEVKAGNQAPAILIFGLIVVFLVLAAQYERWTLPIAVLLAVPFAALGALLAIQWRSMPQDLYFQIGLLVLIGLSAKNAVLIIQFCVGLREQGVSIREAAVQGARIRLRPIVMTSLAFIFGVMPLALATGALSNARHSIGTGVIGGMVAVVVIATFFIPLFYVLIETGTDKITGKSKADAPSPSDPPVDPPPGYTVIDPVSN